MKKWWAVILVMGLLLVSGCAAADEGGFCDPIPQGVQELEKWNNPDGNVCDCILLEDLPVGTCCLVLSPWRMNEYLLQDGIWTVGAQVSPMEQPMGGPLHFRRHAKGAAPGMQGACGLTYPDGAGFDIAKTRCMDRNAVENMMQFRWMDDGFCLVGWQVEAAGQFALWEDGAWAYYNSATGERLGSARIDLVAEYGLLANFENLPLTLDEARRMEAVTRETAETLFPGWTLRSYAGFNMGHDISAGYYRVADGVLTVRRAELSSEAGGVIAQADSMPVPLSEALCKRLETEDISALLNTGGGDDTFLVDDAFDQTAIPITDTVLQNDLQSHGLLLLTEDADGVRRLRLVERNGGGYTVRSTRPLPEDVCLDLFHIGDDGVLFEWNGHYSQCCFSRMADGNWTLGWVTGKDSETLYGTAFCGVLRRLMANTPGGVLVGTHPWRDMFTVDFTQLPADNEAAAAALNRDGWAVVHNPDPADRLHLRAGPGRAYESLGKFYSRTPVQVLEQQEEWSRVRIGLDGRLEGWMLTKYLAFGDAMDAVASAVPDLCVRKEYLYRPLFATPALRETTGVMTGSGMDSWIVGVAADDLYILLDVYGNTGYLPQCWFDPGNG